MSWRLSDLGNELSQPAVSTQDNLVVITDADPLFNEIPRVVAFDLRNGNERWATEGSRTLPVITLDGDVVYGTETEVLCFDADGVERWRAPLSSQRAVGIAVSDGGLIVVGTGLSLDAFDTEGVLQWSVEMYASTPNLAIGPDGTTYLYDSNYWVYAVSPDGSMKWQRQLAATIEDLMFQDGPVLVQQDRLVGLSADDGSDVWAVDFPLDYETQSATRSQPIATEDGMLWMATDFGTVGIKDGALAANGEVGCRSGMAAGSDGRLYAHCNTEAWIADHAFMPRVQIVGQQHVVLSDASGEPVWWPTKPSFEPFHLGGTGDPFGSPALAKGRAVYSHAVNVYDLIALSRAPDLADSAWPRAHADNRNSGQAR